MFAFGFCFVRILQRQHCEKRNFWPKSNVAPLLSSLYTLYTLWTWFSKSKMLKWIWSANFDRKSKFAPRVSCFNTPWRIFFLSLSPNLRLIQCMYEGHFRHSKCRAIYPSHLYSMRGNLVINQVAPSSYWSIYVWLV